MRTGVIPIRVLLPNLKDLATEGSSEANLDIIFEAARDTFYYFFDKFNVTLLMMNATVSDLGQSKGKEILIALDKDLADSAAYDFTPTFLPQNVTVSGTLTTYSTCFFITFPKMVYKLEQSTALDFLRLLFGFSYQIFFILLMLLINFLWYIREGGSFLGIH